MLYEIRERVGAGDVWGAYRAPLAAARFSARDCSCMVTRPPSEPTVVSFPLGRIGDAHSRRAVPLDPKSDPGSSLLSHRPLAQQTQVEQAKRLTVWLPKNIYGRSSSTLGHINKRSACINLQHVIESTNTHMIQRRGVRVMNADAVLA